MIQSFSSQRTSGCGPVELKYLKSRPGMVFQVVGASSHTPRGCRFDFWSGHLPRLQVQFVVGVCMGDNGFMFLSLSSPLPSSSLLPPSLPPSFPSSLSKISKQTNPQVRIKKSALNLC